MDFLDFLWYCVVLTISATQRKFIKLFGLGDLEEGYAARGKVGKSRSALA